MSKFSADIDVEFYFHRRYIRQLPREYFWWKMQQYLG